jgi:coatomer subunit zeta
MLDGMTIVYRSQVDLFFYVVGSRNENEIILSNVLNCFYDSVSKVLRRHIEKKYLLHSLDLVLLAIDEICDDGIILETDSSQVLSRIDCQGEEIPLSEQTVYDLFKSAKEQIKTSLRN